MSQVRLQQRASAVGPCPQTALRQQHFSVGHFWRDVGQRRLEDHGQLHGLLRLRQRQHRLRRVFCSVVTSYSGSGGGSGSGATRKTETAADKEAKRLTKKATEVPIVAKVSRDQYGRISSVRATIKPENLYGGTSTTEAAARNLTRPDDAGHIIGKLLGGPGGLTAENIFKQLPGINRGAFRDFEAQIADEVRAGKAVKVEIEFEYPNTITDRPSGIEYSLTVNGVTTTKTFGN